GAMSGGTRGQESGTERRSAAIRAAVPSWVLRRPPTKPMLAARQRLRRPTVPPDASTLRYQASLRETSATVCSATAATITAAEAPVTPASSSDHLPTSIAPSTRLASTEALTVRATRRLRRIRSKGGPFPQPLVESTGRQAEEAA